MRSLPVAATLQRALTFHHVHAASGPSRRSGPRKFSIMQRVGSMGGVSFAYRVHPLRSFMYQDPRS